MIQDRSETKNEIIIIERDLDNFPCPTEEEIKSYLDSFDYYNKIRVLSELMLITGCRIGEAVKAKVQDFSKDYTLWKYRVQKPLITIKYDEEKNTVFTVVDYKTRSVQIPPWFAQKLNDYFEINKYSIDAGFLFFSRNHSAPHISTAQVRDTLRKKRQQLGILRQWKHVVKICEKSDKEQYHRQNWYALSCHGFRRFYVSVMFNKLVDHGVDNALVMIGKMLGHSRPMHTTSIYLSPRAAMNKCPKVYDPDFISKKEAYQEKVLEKTINRKKRSRIFN
jgi:integrase